MGNQSLSGGPILTLKGSPAVCYESAGSNGFAKMAVDHCLIRTKLDVCPLPLQYSKLAGI